MCECALNNGYPNPVLGLQGLVKMLYTPGVNLIKLLGAYLGA
jgi:hypothetical protein